MKICIAGSRSFKGSLAANWLDIALLAFFEMQDIQVRSVEIICGMAPGADLEGRRWANELGLRVHEFPAKWKDVNVPGAVVRTNKWGQKYNVMAGHDRNKIMAREADIVIVFWDGESSGSQQMIEYSKSLGKLVQVFLFNKNLLV